MGLCLTCGACGTPALPPSTSCSAVTVADNPPTASSGVPQAAILSLALATGLSKHRQMFSRVVCAAHLWVEIREPSLCSLTFSRNGCCCSWAFSVCRLLIAVVSLDESTSLRCSGSEAAAQRVQGEGSVVVPELSSSTACRILVLSDQGLNQCPLCL